MKLIIAKHIGFCSGVKRAIMISRQALKEKAKPVQFLGSIVHNEQVVKSFLKKGVIFKKNIEDIKKGALIIQAHGAPFFKHSLNNNIKIKDATCPLVKKVQLLAQSLEKQAYQIIILGDKNHSEVKGIKGYLKNKSIIIKNVKEAEKIILPKNKRIGLISQTTQSLDNFNKVVKILRKKFKKIKYYNTICPEVQIRQKETKSIIKKADLILLIGSKSSANTKELYRLCQRAKKKICWINSLQELKEQKLDFLPKKREKEKEDSFLLGVISGTSAQNSEIKKIINYLEN